jgi:hypothetical protein
VSILSNLRGLVGFKAKGKCISSPVYGPSFKLPFTIYARLKYIEFSVVSAASFQLGQDQAVNNCWGYT